jgi:tRNA (cytidine/uridine-2'-O-)-methyltransferase
MFSIALYEPEIPPNAGNIARLCAATGTSLHLIGRLGFSFRHPDAKRAAMDYWEKVEWTRHINYDDFRTAVAPRRIWKFTTHATRTFWEAEYAEDDVLLFGPESRGLPASLLESDPEHCVRIPMLADARSLNLATAAGVALYEALRQTAGFGIRDSGFGGG